jgi:hypothetical protein
MVNGIALITKLSKNNSKNKNKNKNKIYWPLEIENVKNKIKFQT